MVKIIADSLRLCALSDHSRHLRSVSGVLHSRGEKLQTVPGSVRFLCIPPTTAAERLRLSAPSGSEHSTHDTCETSQAFCTPMMKLQRCRASPCAPVPSPSPPRPSGAPRPCPPRRGCPPCPCGRWPQRRRRQRRCWRRCGVALGQRHGHCGARPVGHEYRKWQCAPPCCGVGHGLVGGGRRRRVRRWPRHRPGHRRLCASALAAPPPPAPQPPSCAWALWHSQGCLVGPAPASQHRASELCAPAPGWSTIPRGGGVSSAPGGGGPVGDPGHLAPLRPATTWDDLAWARRGLFAPSTVAAPAAALASGRADRAAWRRPAVGGRWAAVGGSTVPGVVPRAGGGPAYAGSVSAADTVAPTGPREHGPPGAAGRAAPSAGPAADASVPLTVAPLPSAGEGRGVLRPAHGGAAASTPRAGPSLWGGPRTLRPRICGGAGGSSSGA